MGWFLLTGVVAIGPGRLLFYYSIRRIGVSRAALLGLLPTLFLSLTPFFIRLGCNPCPIHLWEACSRPSGC